jgi:hypothetical protein
MADDDGAADLARGSRGTDGVLWSREDAWTWVALLGAEAMSWSHRPTGRALEARAIRRATHPPGMLVCSRGARAIRSR